MDTNIRRALHSSGKDGGHALSNVVRPADGALFFSLGDRNAVFCESSQKIYELNQIAAYIWCRLEDQATTEEICDELTRRGIGAGLAEQHFREALRSWLKLGLLKVGYGFDVDALPVERSFNLNIAGFDVTIRVASERLTRLFAPFGHLLVPARDRGHVFHVIETDGLVHVFHNKLHVICCDHVEIAPSIKAYVIEQIVKMSRPKLVFHAACLVRGSKSILISGRPGAGKTTLALRLAEAGFEYSADDVVLIAPDGSATGISFAPAIKSGAWDIVNQFRPDLSGATIHRRPDGKRVRYLSPTHIARQGGHPVGWIVYIKRTAGPARLKPLEPVESIRRLMAGCRSPDGKLSVAECRTLNRTLAGAGSFELTYSDLNEATGTLARVCDG